jgi:hypothetical protein
MPRLIITGILVFIIDQLLMTAMDLELLFSESGSSEGFS